MSLPLRSSHSNPPDTKSPRGLEVELTLNPIACSDVRHALLLEQQLEALLALILHASEEAA